MIRVHYVILDLEGLDGVQQIKDDVAVNCQGKEHNVRLEAELARLKEFTITL